MTPEADHDLVQRVEAERQRMTTNGQAPDFRPPAEPQGDEGGDA